MNIPLFVIDFILILPITLLRAFLIWILGATYDIPSLSILDTLMSGDLSSSSTQSVPMMFQERKIKSIRQPTNARSKTSEIFSSGHSAPSSIKLPGSTTFREKTPKKIDFIMTESDKGK
jgi:hypothetical protein